MSRLPYRVGNGHLHFSEMAVPRNSVIHGDCVQVMAGLPDSSVDFVLTDPPYVCDCTSTWEWNIGYVQRCHRERSLQRTRLQRGAQPQHCGLSVTCGISGNEPPLTKAF